MSIQHLNTLFEQLPELFQSRELAPFWDDDLILVPVDDVEAFDEVLNLPKVLDREDGEINSLELEDWGIEEIEPGAPWPDLSGSIVDVLGGAHAGAPVPYSDRTKMPPTDCLAFYLPFHYYYPDLWGTYLIFDGVLWLAGEIVRRSQNRVPLREAIKAARLFLFYHEAFHHKTECFATRLEVTHRKPLFKTGFERLYQKTWGTIDCFEEGLANAEALKTTNNRTKNVEINSALEGFVIESPPGYDQGVQIRSEFLSARCKFAEENQELCLPQLPPKNPDVWRTAGHMFSGIANIKSRVNYVIPRNSPLAARLPFRPLLPPSKLVKKLNDLVGLEFVRHGGNHDIYQLPSGVKIPIPRHSRDMGRGLIRKILRESGLSISMNEFLSS